MDLTLVYVSIAVIIGLAFIAVASIMSEEDGVKIANLIGFAVLAISFLILIGDSDEKNTIVIEKSSDSDWELSKEKILRDTSITRIVVLSTGDTTYPTTHYKVLRRYGKE